MNLLTIQKQALVISLQEQSNVKGGTDTSVTTYDTIIVTDINTL